MSRLFVSLFALAGIGALAHACGSADSDPLLDSDGATRDGQSTEDAPLSSRSVPEPPSPTFPATVGTLSIGVRTANVVNAGSNSAFEVCFSETAGGAPGYCHKLDLQGVDDFRVGDFDRHHFEGVAMPRDKGKFVLFRPEAGSGDDAVRLDCLDVRFDGEPVSCTKDLNKLIGSGAASGESARLELPLANNCDSCETGKLTAGPKLGVPDSDRVRVWVRTDATRKVALRISESADGSSSFVAAWAFPRPEDDFAKTLESAAPLDPNRAYYYRIDVDGESKSPWQALKTAGVANGKIVIGLGSCAKEVAQPIYTALGKSSFDLFLYLGDNHYGNTALLDAHRFEYRRLDRLNARTSFLAKTPSLATWDDHDFVENNSDSLCPGGAAALRAFKEHWPNPAFGTSQTEGAFSRARLGVVDIFMLDCRMYRPRVDDPLRDCQPGVPPPAGQYLAAGPLGEAQYQWLMNELSASQAPFKFVTCGSLFTDNGGISSWFAYPEGRNRLFTDLNSRNIRGILFGSGDVHHSEFRRYDRGAGGGYPLYEFVSSPLARANANSCADDPDPQRIGDCYDAGNSYVSIEFDGTLLEPTATARIFSETGTEQAKLTVKQSQL